MVPRNTCVLAFLPDRQRELEEAAAAAAAAAGVGSTSSRSGKAQRVAFGADDLLAALTWVVVQVGGVSKSSYCRCCCL